MENISIKIFLQFLVSFLILISEVTPTKRTNGESSTTFHNMQQQQKLNYYEQTNEQHEQFTRLKRDSNSIGTNNWYDNRKPAFKHCKDYAPSVKEEQEAGAFVIKVEAEDPDINQTIRYSFVSAAAQRPKFRIDTKTGVITTAHSFDRDEPIFETEAYITVQATDNGRPPLSDVCTFKVIIEDINDNTPAFNKATYEELMSEDTMVNRVVMRISATDLDDGNNSIVEYEILPVRDHGYFRMDKAHGIIYLNLPIDKRPGQSYFISVRAYNIVPEPHRQEAVTEVKITIIESSKKPPRFIDAPEEPIYLKENFRDYSYNITTLRATSNVPDQPEVIFELINGRTEQTNSKNTFVLNQHGDTVTINLGKSLDYEAITEYTLTVSVRNIWELVAEHIFKIKIEDVNDNIPFFTEVKTGSISENEPAGTPVMQVRAFDMDGTSANNIVSFELADNKDYFTIDPQTGNITALTTFDREERDFYNVKVIASDNSPSSLFQDNEPNRGQQVFRIEIADKNDHKPHFQRDEYIADKLPENANVNHLVIEVNAVDLDNAAQIVYTIESGNIDEAFKIEKLTGKISVNRPLDYEKIVEYTLKIRAFDGIYDDYATVTIKLENVNDNPPVFLQKYNITLQEETVIKECILIVQAYDPDIKDRNADQGIKYSVVKEEQRQFLSIDDSGCLKLIQPLDRDSPNGFKNWQIWIRATDDNGSINGKQEITDITITLIDINDNAPHLSLKLPVIWPENRIPGQIVQLQAIDYDEQQNGPPFTYGIDTEASEDIKNKFSIDNDYLYANVLFDREEQKEYFIPIRIFDSGQPRQSDVSILHLIIGDVNDNPMEPGSSRIFVYNFKGESPDTDIGRVFVNDKDDWDLPDKQFIWKNAMPHQYFRLNADTGMITMLETIPPGEYFLPFVVTEESEMIKRHQVDAEVTVIVKYIPEEAVDKSGSIRLYNITAEDFIKVPREDATILSLKDRFQNSVARMFNISAENVDVFTVLNYNASILDVRFSAHGSPYYEPERLNGMVAQARQDFEEDLGIQILMVNIDECLIEKQNCESSCKNILHKSTVPLLVYTNTTSFVGVNAYTKAECICEPEIRHECLNGGSFRDDACECAEGFNGPHCELTGIGFYGIGYAMYPPISPCDNTKISMELEPQTDTGLVMYIGPMNYNPLLPIADFLSLELVKGYPVLKVDYGTGAVKIEHKHIQLLTGRSYQIDILLQKASVEMTVDNCKLSTCMSLGAPEGPNEFLNVNSPLQLGGTPVDLKRLGKQLNWTHIPEPIGYHGCIKNLTIDGFTYNIGQPPLSHNVDPGCQNAIAVAVSFGIDRNFLIAILVCIAVLLILLLAVVVQKRQQNGWHEKDMDDIRETIINYEDEGGGERDTDYDLNVLRSQPYYEDKPYKESMHPVHHIKDPNEVPDIGGFLVDKKDSCDRDSGAFPNDDVRHYAYEGDGNSDGSLSSLASCTDEGDLNFDYLSNFGPRFRKLADMYGEEPSDTDSNVDDDQGWRI